MNNYVLFSPIGNHDPFGKTGEQITEGPMLHIVRHYKPKIVILFLTKEMYEKEQKDKRYTLSIKHFLPDCKTEILSSGNDIVNPHDFDVFVKPYGSIFERIKEQYPDYEILFNVSSGTPQMISEIILEAQTTNIKTRAVQVITPQRRANIPDNYEADDIEFIDNEIETADNRCVEPDFNAFKKMKLKSQILALIENYEYKAALNLIQNEDAKLFSEDLIKLLKHTYYRSVYDLQKTKEYAGVCGTKSDSPLFEYFFTIKLKQKKGELDDMVLKITPFLSKILRKCAGEYYPLDNITTIDGKKEEIRRETLEEKDKKLLEFLDNNFKGSYKSGFVNNQTLKCIFEYSKNNLNFKSQEEENNFNRIKRLFNKFIDLESNIRNAAAHDTVCIDEELLKGICQEKSKDIIKDLETLLKLTSNFSGGFIYEDLNSKIKSLL